MSFFGTVGGLQVTPSIPTPMFHRSLSLSPSQRKGPHLQTSQGEQTLGIARGTPLTLPSLQLTRPDCPRQHSRVPTQEVKRPLSRLAPHAPVPPPLARACCSV